jgi:hypothetical protein
LGDSNVQWITRRKKEVEASGLYAIIGPVVGAVNKPSSGVIGYNPYEFDRSDHSVSLESEGLIHPFALSLESDLPAIKKAFWVWNPDKNKMYGSTKMKTAVLWSVAVNESVKAWLEVTKTEFVSWIPGFIFAEDREAAHKKQGLNHIIMVRPVNEDGTASFSIRNRKDIVRVLLLAAHEVTHFNRDYHDEDFSNTNLEINHAIFSDLPGILNRIRFAVDAIEPKVSLEKLY